MRTRLLNGATYSGLTDFNGNSASSMSTSTKEAIFGQIPMRRMGEAAEIASIVRFLASDEAAYITGQTLHVNGGMYMSQ